MEEEVKDNDEEVKDEELGDYDLSKYLDDDE